MVWASLGWAECEHLALLVSPVPTAARKDREKPEMDSFYIFYQTQARGVIKRSLEIRRGERSGERDRR